MSSWPTTSAMVERIYQTAGLAMTSAARTQLDTFMGDNPRGKHGRIEYDLTRRLRPRSRRGARPLLRTTSIAFPYERRTRERPASHSRIVGCGAIAHWHLDAVDRAGLSVTITAAIDPDAENARSARGPHQGHGLRVAHRCARRPQLRCPPHRGSASHLHEAVATEALAAGSTCCSRSRSRRRSTRPSASSRRRRGSRGHGVHGRRELAILARGADGARPHRRRRDRRRDHRARRDVLSSTRRRSTAAPGRGDSTERPRAAGS